MSRAEHQGPPELFYNEKEARKCTQKDRLNKLRGKNPKRNVDWILVKKKKRRQGKETCLDSKYSGRRRCGKF